MILRALPHSPYVRKVLVIAHETGQISDLEIVTAHVFDPETPLLAENPLGKVPTLILGNGAVLFDSTVICEWLCDRAGINADGDPVFPAPPDRWQSITLNALGDGLGQAATWNIRERCRPEGERAPSYMAYYDRAIDRSLQALENAADRLAGGFDIGAISVACALSYLDFRYPDRAWRADHPALGAWYDRIGARPSMTATPLGPYDGPLQP